MKLFYRIFLMAVLAFLLFTNASQAKVNSCVAHMVIPSLPFSSGNMNTDNTTSKYDQTAPGACGSNYEDGREYLWAYTTGSSEECLLWSLSYDLFKSTGFGLYEGCPSQAGSSCLFVEGTGYGTTNREAPLLLKPNTTYYFVVNQFPRSDGMTDNPFSFTLTSNGGPAPNNTKCSAEFVPVGSNTSWFDFNCANNINDPAPPSTSSCFFNYDDKSLWYKTVVPASGKVYTRTENDGGQIFAAMYQGSDCNSLSLVSGKNCDGASCGAEKVELFQRGLTPGDTIWLRLNPRSGNEGMQGRVLVDGDIPYKPAQDCGIPMQVCSDLVTIGSPGFLSDGYVCDFEGAPCTNLASESSSAWYYFSTSGAGTLNFTISPQYSTPWAPDIDWALFDVTGHSISNLTTPCEDILMDNDDPIRSNWGADRNNGPNGQTGMKNGSGSTCGRSGSGRTQWSRNLNVTAGQSFLLMVNNFSNSSDGYTIDFKSSPINYTTADRVVWTAGSATDPTDWFDADNWGGCKIPDCNTDAYITGGMDNYPIIDQTGAVCRDLFTGFDNRRWTPRHGTLTIQSGYDLEICGNIELNGILNAENSSSVSFTNAANVQTVRGKLTNTNSFFNINVLKSGSDIILYDSLELQGTLNLSSGNIITNDYVIFVNNDADNAIINHSANSFIEGFLARKTRNSGDFDLPVGHASKGYQLANVTFSGATTVESLLASFNEWSALPTPLNATFCTYDWDCDFLNNGYWTINAFNSDLSNQIVGTGNYDVSLFNESVTNNTCGAYHAAKNDGSGWSIEGSCNVSNTIDVTGISLSGFSDFATVQSTDAPLSNHFLSFSASPKHDFNVLSWSFVEVDKGFFTIESGSNDENLKPIAKIKAGEVVNYEVTDYDAERITYYRVVYNNPSENFKLSSQVIKVERTSQENFIIVPNPAVNSINIFYSNFESITQLQIIDFSGKLVQNFDNVNTENSSIDISHLRSGKYFVSIILNTGERITQRLIINR